jgi:hypothetical protein
LSLIDESKTDREIANALGRTLESIRSYRRKRLNIRRKNSGREKWLGESGRRLRKMIISDYRKGLSQSRLVRKYHVEWRKLREILVQAGINIRSKSQQAFIEKYGRLPTIWDKLSKEKLYVIFALLGDNLRPSSQMKRHTYIIGIAAGKDRDFAEFWKEGLEK